MTEYIVKEHMTIVNDNEKTAYVVQMLQQYIRNLRSPTFMQDISIESFELFHNNKVISGGNMRFDNSAAVGKSTAWILNDDFLGPVITENDFEDSSANPICALFSDDDETNDIITFRISYICEPAVAADVGFRYWQKFFYAFDCDELRESVTYRCLSVKAGAEDNNYNFWFNRNTGNAEDNDYTLYVFNSMRRGCVMPVDCDFIPESKEEWELSEINIDDYNDIYTWLALSEEEWSQKAIEKCEPLFKKLGAQVERYSESPHEDDEEDCKYVFQGLNIFSGKIKGDNVNDFIDCYDSLIKYLRSMSNGKEKPDGNSFRYIIGEGENSLALVILDDSDPDYDGVKIRCARI